MKGRVLIVDDSALSRRTLRQILEPAGYEVAEAEDGLSALERYFLEKPDIVLLDLVMKGMYGLDVLTKLRELDADAKVVIVSADIQTSSHELVEAAGARAFVNKPFDRADILSTLAERPDRSRGMILTAVQEDALTEVINIGFGRAAASLSKLTGQRVQLEVPHIAMCPIDELSDRLRPMIENEVASVHQIFSGAVAGDALLVIDQQSAAILKELLTNEPALPLDIDASAREVLTEIGNILLNACLGTFGNLLHVQVSFSVPHLTLESLEGVVGSITVNREGLRYALIVHAGFRLKNSSLTGYLVIVLSVASIERLIRAVEQWERDQR